MKFSRYWCASHVFQTQYTIQIVRCTKTECCGPWRSNYVSVFPHRFLPPPVPFNRSSNGVSVADLESSMADRNSISPYYGTIYQRIQFHGLVMRRTENQFLPFDAFCPSVQDRLYSRVCSICKQYIPLATRLRNHYKVHQQRYSLCRRDSIDLTQKKEEETIEESDPIDPTDLPSAPINFSQGGVFIFTDLMDWLKSDFEEEPVVDTKTKSIAATAMAMIRKEKQQNTDTNTTARTTTSDTINSTNDPVETVAIIAVDSALQDSPVIPSVEVKTEQEECFIDRIEHLNMNDDENTSMSFRSDSYDDLSDLLDKI